MSDGRPVDALLELQRLDTTADQLTHRRARLPERDAAEAASGELAALRARRAALTAREAELASAIEALEGDGRTMTAQRARLEGQLRTASSTRAADALTHELAALAARRDEMDDQELAHLDEQATVTEELATLDSRAPAVEAAAQATGTELAAAEASVDAELAATAAARAELVAGLDAGLLARYERLRARLGGVAVARLDAKRCTGCHLDLSAAELEQVRATPAGQWTECPECGRLLVP